MLAGTSVTPESPVIDASEGMVLSDPEDRSEDGEDEEVAVVAGAEVVGGEGAVLADRG